MGNTQGRHLFIHLLLFALTVGVLGVATSVAAVACTRTWDGEGPTDDWEVAANWAGDVLPAPSDNVCVGEGVDARISSDVVIRGFQQFSPGSLSISLGASLRLADAGFSETFGQILNDGSISVGGAGGRFTLQGGGNGSGTFTTSETAQIRFGGGGGSGSLYELEDGARLSGDVRLGIALPEGCDPRSEACDHPENGNLQVATGATATLDGRMVFSAGFLRGTGTLLVEGTLEWASDPGGPASLQSNLEVATNGTLRVNGPFGHLGGTNGCGEQHPCGGVNFGNDQGIAITIVNRGTTIVEDAGYIAASDGTTFQNIGTFDIRNDRGYYQGFYVDNIGAGRFVNEGELQKSDGSGQSVVDADFSGSGDVSNTSGGELLVTLPGPLHQITGQLSQNSSLFTGTTDETQVSPDGVPLQARSFASRVTNQAGTDISLRLEEGAPSAAGGFTALGQVTLENLTETAGSIDVLAEMLVDSAVVGAGEQIEALQVAVGDQLLGPCLDEIDLNCLAERDRILGDLHVALEALLDHAESATVTILDPKGSPTVIEVGPTGFTQAKVRLRLGRQVEWSSNESMSDDYGDDGGPLFAPHEGVFSLFVISGSFTVHHTASGDALVVKIRPRVNGRRVTWAGPYLPACDGCTFNVQRKPADGEWSTWLRKTTRLKATMKGDRAWKVRARLINGPRRSGWSPPVRVR